MKLDPTETTEEGRADTRARCCPDRRCSGARGSL